VHGGRRGIELAAVSAGELDGRAAAASGSRHPQAVKFQKKWKLALEMMDQVRSWQLGDRMVVADAGYGDVTAFREALEARKLRYAVGVHRPQELGGPLPDPAS
jgi:SRSO17 transposase